MSTQALTGRHALVTGASRGIGAAIAERLLAEGAYVTLLGRKLDPLEALARKLGERATVVLADVVDAVQMQNGVDAASARFGPIDILVNNAGQAASAPLHKMDAALWERMLAVNL